MKRRPGLHGYRAPAETVSYDVEMVAYLGPGLRRARVDPYPAGVWTAGTARKRVECRVCRRMIEKGTISWREQSNALHRAWRVCGSCWPYREDAPPKT